MNHKVDDLSKYDPDINRVEHFEIFLDTCGWFFELWDGIYGPFLSKEEAQLAQDGMIADYYQDEK